MVFRFGVNNWGLLSEKTAGLSSFNKATRSFRLCFAVVSSSGLKSTFSTKALFFSRSGARAEPEGWFGLAAKSS
ncbi:Uncharacterised protein [Streptococcus pneumoniae]|nr:Uncharacterised protein [Streptococcus pneumoniae]VQP17716.1 Uncharacterised protein [Streptococcus pneumoniae]